MDTDRRCGSAQLVVRALWTNGLDGLGRPVRGFDGLDHPVRGLDGLGRPVRGLDGLDHPVRGLDHPASRSPRVAAAARGISTYPLARWGVSGRSTRPSGTSTYDSVDDAGRWSRRARPPGSVVSTGSTTRLRGLDGL